MYKRGNKDWQISNLRLQISNKYQILNSKIETSFTGWIFGFWAVEIYLFFEIWAIEIYLCVLYF